MHKIRYGVSLTGGLKDITVRDVTANPKIIRGHLQEMASERLYVSQTPWCFNNVISWHFNHYIVHICKIYFLDMWISNLEFSLVIEIHSTGLQKNRYNYICIVCMTLFHWHLLAKIYLQQMLRQVFFWRGVVPSIEQFTIITLQASSDWMAQPHFLGGVLRHPTLNQALLSSQVARKRWGGPMEWVFPRVLLGMICNTTKKVE